VQVVIERELRLAMKRERIDKVPLYPEQRRLTYSVAWRRDAVRRPRRTREESRAVPLGLERDEAELGAGRRGSTRTGGSRLDPTRQEG